MTYTALAWHRVVKINGFTPQAVTRHVTTTAVQTGLVS